MSNWTAIVDREHNYSFQLPEITPKDQIVTIVKDSKDGLHQVHAHTPDESELYFEVVSYSGLLNHEQSSTRHKSSLLARSEDGTVSDNVETSLGSMPATAFLFRGTLDNRFKVRRFLFVDSLERTYRIIYDPTSSLNEQVLETLVIGRC